MQATYNKIDWSEQSKIRVRESDLSQQKHLIVKTLVMLHIKIKHQKESKWIKVYSEFPVNKGKICDVYYENIRSQEAVAYEIQKENSKKWLNETKKAYEDWEIYGMNSADYIIIDINKLSDDIETMSYQISKLII